MGDQKGPERLYISRALVPSRCRRAIVAPCRPGATEYRFPLNATLARLSTGA